MTPIKSVVVEIVFVDPPYGDVYYMWINGTISYLIDCDDDRYSAELFSWKTDKDIAERIDRQEMQPFFNTKQGQMFLCNTLEVACGFGCHLRKLPKELGYPTMVSQNYTFRMPDKGMPWQEMFEQGEDKNK